MNYNRHRSIKALVLIVTFTTSMVAVSGCSRSSDIERASTKIEKTLTAKMKSGNKLTPAEINNLSGAYLFKKQYDNGIIWLENLSNDDKYTNDKSYIYLNLAKFYLEQASANRLIAEKNALVEKAKRCLVLGVESSKEKTGALYARSQIYGYEGCIDKAKSDLQSAKSMAQGKELVLFEDGIYVPKDRFISLLQADSDRLNKLTDNCDIH